MSKSVAHFWTRLCVCGGGLFLLLLSFTNSLHILDNNPLQCRTPEFSPWVGKIPWRRGWLPTSVFLPGEFRGQSSLAGYKVHGVEKSWTWLSDQHFPFPPDIWFPNILSHSMGSTFTLWIVSFEETNFKFFMKSNLSLSNFITYAFGNMPRNHYQVQYCEAFDLCILLTNV